MASKLRVDEILDRLGTGPVKAANGLLLPNGGSALSWNEKGVWTPTLYGGTTAGSCTYTIRNGHFSRRDSAVTIRMRCDWTGHTGTGAFRVSGFPYLPAGFDSPLVCMVTGFPSAVVMYMGTGWGTLYQLTGYAEHSVVSSGGLIVGGTYLLD